MNVMNFVISSLVIACLGSIFHFTFDWSGKKKWVGIFSAVNESTWEHIKIGLTGAFIYSIVDVIFFGVGGNFLPAKAAELSVIIVIMPALYYFIELFLKKFVLIVDILEFFATIFLARLAFYGVLGAGELPSWIFALAGIIIVVILYMYGRFTFYPPKNFLFVDVRNGKYGFSASQKHTRRKRRK